MPLRRGFPFFLKKGVNIYENNFIFILLEGSRF